MAETGENAISQNRSMLKEFLASIGTMRGDLSNITAPPFVLDTKSTVELPQYWAEVPSNFVAPALQETPEKRALFVLRWFLSSLRNQQYAGHSEQEGVKKPLNAFLGELFLGHWEDSCGTTYLVSEQVSHHPPVTACRVWNEKHGISAEGYTRQEITFSGSVSIKQIGHAILTLSHHNESYLIPLPNVKVKGILTGNPYPELSGTYSIASTTCYTSTIDFTGKGIFSGKKNSVHASLHHHSDPSTELYTISGQWSDEFTIHDVRSQTDIETFSISAQSPSKLIIAPLDEQDPWESRRAWCDVREALNRGDMQGTALSKSLIEEGQRGMRKQPGLEEKTWRHAFFEDVGRDEMFEKLAAVAGISDKEDTMGVWKFRQQAWNKGITKPFHGELTPDNNGQGRRPSLMQDTGSYYANGGSAEQSNDRNVAAAAIPRQNVEKEQQHQNHHLPAASARRDVEREQQQQTQQVSSTTTRGDVEKEQHHLTQQTSTPVARGYDQPEQQHQTRQQSGPPPSPPRADLLTQVQAQAHTLVPALIPAPQQNPLITTNGNVPPTQERQLDIDQTADQVNQINIHDQQSNGIEMSDREKSQVESLLRKKYSSSGR